MGKQGHYSAELADGMKKSESSSDRIERVADESEQDPQSVSAQGLDLVQVRQMAEQGNMSAQIIMGWCYYYGDGVPQDMVEAEKWYRKAAEQGYEDAIAALKALESGEVNEMGGGTCIPRPE